LTAELNSRSIRDVGRTPGATAADTSQRLLAAAADVFARRGYDGTRVSEIATAAGVSNGALYAHFGSKAELLVGALRAHGRRGLADLVAADPAGPVADALLASGRALTHQDDVRGALVVEALVAARRDEDVADLVRGYLGERAEWLAGLFGRAQAGGEVDPGVPPAAVAHFCLALALGSALLHDLSTVDDDDWGALLSRVVTVLEPSTDIPGPDPRGDMTGAVQ
jgi:AcrR family transcriptional regulator